MRFFYTIGIVLYRILIYVAIAGNEKARKWVAGRKNWKQKLQPAVETHKKVCWIHCSSLGEFEQGRPIIESIKKKNDNIFILLTFYSPSGYEVRKNYDVADLVMYMPSDTPANAKYFVQKVKPAVAVFVKYEFWFNFIKQLHKNSVSFYSISAIFRPGQMFFKPWGCWFLNHLKMFEHFFVQNGESAELLKSYKISQVTISGDTRYDRVSNIAKQTKEQPVVQHFSSGKFTLVAGSSWQEEHEMLVKLANNYPERLKLIIAPHELNEKSFKYIERKVQNKVVRLSKTNEQEVSEAQILIVDSIGLLSSLYRYGEAALIGGGFGKGIHNILEPAVYGVPVMFGPKYGKFYEANEMVKNKIALPINSYKDLEKNIALLLKNKEYLEEKSLATKKFVESKLGASKIIMESIEKKLVEK